MPSGERTSSTGNVCHSQITPVRRSFRAALCTWPGPRLPAAPLDGWRTTRPQAPEPAEEDVRAALLNCRFPPTLQRVNETLLEIETAPTPCGLMTLRDGGRRPPQPPDGDRRRGPRRLRAAARPRPDEVVGGRLGWPVPHGLAMAVAESAYHGRYLRQRAGARLMLLDVLVVKREEFAA